MKKHLQVNLFISGVLCLFVLYEVLPQEEAYLYENFSGDFELALSANSLGEIKSLSENYPFYFEKYLFYELNRYCSEDNPLPFLVQKLDTLVSIHGHNTADPYMNDLWVQYKNFTPEDMALKRKADSALYPGNGTNPVSETWILNSYYKINDFRGVFNFMLEKLRSDIFVIAGSGEVFEKRMNEIMDFAMDSDKLQLKQLSAMAYLKYGDVDRALLELDQSLSVCREGKDLVSSARIQFQKGEIFSRTGYFDRAFECFREALQIFRTSGIDEEHAAICTSIGNLYLRKKDEKSAERFFDDAFAIYTRLQNNVGQARILNNLGVVYQRSGNNDKSLESFTKSMEIAKKGGDLYQIAETGNNLGGYYLTASRFDEARKAYGEAIESAEKCGAVEIKSKALHNMGLAYYFSGRKNDAIASISESLSYSRRNRYDADALESAYVLGKIYADENNSSRSREMFDTAIDLAEKTGRADRKKEIEDILKKQGGQQAG